jgi:hypothetical protein
MAPGMIPTLIALPALLVAVWIGVTVPVLKAPALLMT